MAITKSGERVQIGQLELTFIVSGEECGGHVDVFEMMVPPGARVPIPHFHTEIDEVVVGLEGVLTYRVGDTTHEVRPGDRVFSPRGVEHHFQNLHDTPARALNILTPGKTGIGYFRDVAAVINAGGPPDMAKLAGVMKHYGLVPSPPKAPAAVRAPTR